MNRRLEELADDPAWLAWEDEMSRLARARDDGTPRTETADYVSLEAVAARPVHITDDIIDLESRRAAGLRARMRGDGDSCAFCGGPRAVAEVSVGIDGREERRPMCEGCLRASAGVRA